MISTVKMIFHHVKLGFSAYDLLQIKKLAAIALIQLAV
jgi:hypothetical protein